jgi:hypothetical protein
MKAKLILTAVLLATFANLHAQDLLRPDSSRLRWFVKPPPIHETIKPPVIGVFRNIDEFQQNQLIVFDTFPATWNQFKLTFLALPLPEEFALIERFRRNMDMGEKCQKCSIWFNPEEHSSTLNRIKSLMAGYPAGQGSGGVGGGGLSTSVIQQLYDEYSREGKMLRKYNSLIQQEEFERQIYPNYNVTLVKQITGFTSDSAAYTFMRFCDFKNDSLLQANNYDIYWMIQNCLSQFLLQERK